MDPVTLSLLMTGAGALSGVMGNAQKAKQAKAQMMVRAAEQQASPWTGMPVQTAATFDQGGPGNVLQGAISGYGSGQALQSASAKDALNEKQIGFQEDELALKKQELDQNNAWLKMQQGISGPAGQEINSDRMALGNFAYKPFKMRR